MRPSGPDKETACGVVQPRCLIYQGCGVGGGTWEFGGGKRRCVLVAEISSSERAQLGSKNKC